MTIANWVFEEPRMGLQPIAETSTVAKVPLGMIAKARHATYGVGEFIYLQGVASTGLGEWVLFAQDDWSTALLPANGIGEVAIAMSANVASQYGWYQRRGRAIGKALTGFADNANVYATATSGSVDDAVVSGDRVKRAKGASAVGTPSSGLAEFEIDNPYMDDGLAA